MKKRINYWHIAAMTQTTAVFIILSLALSSACAEGTFPRSFLPNNSEDFASKYADIWTMGRVPNNISELEDGARNAMISNLAAEFWESAKYFLKAEMLPATTSLMKSLVLAPDAGWVSEQSAKKADIAYLPTRIGDRDALLAETGGLGAKIGISLALLQGEEDHLANAQDAARLAERILGEFLAADGEAPFQVRAEPAGAPGVFVLAGKEGSGPAMNHRQTLRGVLSSQGMVLVFSKYPFAAVDVLPSGGATVRMLRPLPAYQPPGDKWFDYIAGKYRPAVGGKSSR